MRHYNAVKAELEQELKADGKWRCFFSWLPIPDEYTWKDVSWHHLKGRDNENLIEKEYLVPVIDKYHTGDEGWHNKPLSFLKDLWWFNGFMERLKAKDEGLYYRVKIKL